MSGRFDIGACALRAAFIVVLVARIAAPGAAHADAAEAKRIFTTRCTACHTFGKGVKVGPDLKGVAERRQRAWIIKFVQSSSTVIASGDKTATDLLAQFNQMRMPDWVDLTDAQIGSIIDWLAANGPDQQDIDARLAESATLAEIESGRQLFHGTRPLKHGGAACAACHSIRDSEGAIGGSLAPDLTGIYSAYQDGAVTQFLRHPCFQRYPESANAAFLTPEESFYLKGYLRHAVLTDRSKGAGVAAGVAKPVDRTALPSASADGRVRDPAVEPGAGPASPGSAAGSPAAVTATQHVAWAPRSGDTSIVPPPHATRLESTLFAGVPYLALLVLFVGLGVRHVLSRRRAEADRRAATTSAWQLFGGGAVWRVGLVATILLHLLAIVMPRAVLAWNGAPMRLYLLEAAGILSTALAIVGWVQIMRRYVGRGPAPRAAASELADGVLLSLLGLALVSSLVISVTYRWSSSWAAGTIAPYIVSLADGEPATELIGQLPFLVRLHVLSWFAVAILVPFSSFALVLVSLAHRVLEVIGRPFEAAASAGKATARKLSPARWLWPEEDAVELVREDNAKGHS